MLIASGQYIYGINCPSLLISISENKCPHNNKQGVWTFRLFNNFFSILCPHMLKTSKQNVRTHPQIGYTTKRRS